MYRESFVIKISIEKNNMKRSYVYILKCFDNSYYTGVSSNLTQRLFQHETGFYPECYTASKRPVELVYYCEFTDINFAIDIEKKIKKWSRAKKEALINEEYDKLPNLAKKKF
jgi:putative endonuclease